MSLFETEQKAKVASGPLVVNIVTTRRGAAGANRVGGSRNYIIAKELLTGLLLSRARHSVTFPALFTASWVVGRCLLQKLLGALFAWWRAFFYYFFFPGFRAAFPILPNNKRNKYDFHADCNSTREWKIHCDRLIPSNKR